MDVRNIKAARHVIETEAAALAELGRSIGGEFTRAVDLIEAARGKLIVTGMGKAGNIGAKISATMRSTGTRSAFLHPGEALHGDMGMIGAGDVLLALSNSGETDEVLAVARYCVRHRNPVVAISSNPFSPIARLADVALVLPESPEGCPLERAPMASASMMLALGDGLAAQLMADRGFTDEDFLELHHGGYLGRKIEGGD